MPKHLFCSLSRLRPPSMVQCKVVSERLSIEPRAASRPRGLPTLHRGLEKFLGIHKTLLLAPREIAGPMTEAEDADLFRCHAT